jgi:hypothetical protein
VVVRLGIVEARAQAANGLPMDSLGMWCRVAMEVAGGFHRVVEVRTREATFECMVEVVGCFGDGSARMEVLASVLGYEGSQQCNGVLQVLFFLGLCVASRLRRAELLLASS